MLQNNHVLLKCQLFRNLSPQQLLQLDADTTIHSYPKRSTLYRPNDPADTVMALLDGRVKISSDPVHGRRAILAFIEPGELFAESAVFDGPPREQSAETLEACTVVHIPVARLKRLIGEHHQLALDFISMVGHRRRLIERRLKQVLFHSHQDRLIHLLIDLAEHHGQSGPDGMEIGLRLSHLDLANIIGSTRETVTVTLGALQAQGLVHVRRRRVTIVEPDMLAERVNRPFETPEFVDTPALVLSRESV